MKTVNISIQNIEYKSLDHIIGYLNHLKESFGGDSKLSIRINFNNYDEDVSLKDDQYKQVSVYTKQDRYDVFYDYDFVLWVKDKE